MTTEQNLNTQADADLFEVSMDTATEKASAFIQSFVGQGGGLRALGMTTMVVLAAVAYEVAAARYETDTPTEEQVHAEVEIIAKLASMLASAGLSKIGGDGEGTTVRGVAEH